MIEEPTERELAIFRIASSIRNSLELPDILQTTVDEVGKVLGIQHCALRVDWEPEQPPAIKCYFRDGEPTESEHDALVNDLNAYHARLLSEHDVIVQEGGESPVAVVPLAHHLRFMGSLMVRSDDPKHIWQNSEILLLRIVADQVAVAVNHARLFTLMQQLALTDSLTGCVNRRSFEMQLERDLRLGTRMCQPVALIMLDIDHFKRVNDTHGHGAGDQVLRLVARLIKAELRGVDTAARYGGEEFMIILPQADERGAIILAERIRHSVEQAEVPGVGHVTVSLGIAIYPSHADDRDRLLSLVDQALYAAKRSGRNRVCLAG